MESPEVESSHVRRHGGLPRWLELVIALTALVTSISSIAIAVHHGRVMERLVQANSIPYLQGGFSDTTFDGKPILTLDLLNRGVGPAHEKSLRVKVGDQYVRSFEELMATSLGPDRPKEAHELLRPIWNRVSTRFIPGGQSQTVFRVAKTPENATLWDQFAKDQVRWEIDFCYCSIFNECWQQRGKWKEPEPVGQCVRDESREFIP